MPYRIDLHGSGDEALDRLVELGAIDVELSERGDFAALMPDGVTVEQVARVLGVDRITASPAVGRDADSIWLLSPRPIRVGRLHIVPAGDGLEPRRETLQLVDSAAFGTGLHPTTALCLEALHDEVASEVPAAMLDVGTGSGVLALAALLLGVPHATGVDVDDEALRTAAENARLNRVADRLKLVRGGAEAVNGSWTLVMANVLAAPLIEMAPTLVRRLGHRGRLVLSGIPSAVEADVNQAYQRLGLRHVRSASRAGWVALVLQASW